MQPGNATHLLHGRMRFEPGICLGWIHIGRPGLLVRYLFEALSMHPRPKGLAIWLAVPVSSEQAQGVVKVLWSLILYACLPQGLQAAESLTEGPACGLKSLHVRQQICIYLQLHLGPFCEHTQGTYSLQAAEPWLRAYVW